MIRTLSAPLTPLFVAALVTSITPTAASAQSVTIPRVTRAPHLADFTSAEGVPIAARELAVIEGLVQRTPDDGAPISEKTTVLVGYDDRNLYAVFLCASAPGDVRAHRVNRDRIPDDDESIALQLDTFRDGRRLYGFQVNPVGVQTDGIYTEGQGWDLSFDTIWDAETAMLPDGYIVLLTIPFRGLRFPAAAEHRWGLFVYRGIPRKSEEAFWPAYSIRYQGRLAYAAELLGVHGIQAGRSMQLTPYTTVRAERVEAAGTASQTEGRIGLDAKLTPRENLVLDLTAKPDFSQVESDEPQTTVNQRFEVFFPERRPFFIENASYFQTPLQVLFTRRIQEPQLGARFSGKAGKYAVGALFADDVADDAVTGRAYTTAFRVSRDLSAGSHVGMIYTGRRDDVDANHVGGVDGRWRLGKHVATSAQLVGSRTDADGSGTVTGTAYQTRLDTSSRRLTTSVIYGDVSPDFVAASGFVPRTDVRELSVSTALMFRPSGSRLLSWGPLASADRLWSHGGEALDARVRLDLGADFARQTHVGVFRQADENRLRPSDVPTLTSTERFAFGSTGVTATTAPLSGLALTLEYSRGTAINLEPAAGSQPGVEPSDAVRTTVSVRPAPAFTIDTTYVWTRLSDDGGSGSIFSDHLLRSRWNYQVTRRLSARLIVSSKRLHADPAQSSLRPERGVNLDVLVTYFVRPGTALYVGLNGDRQGVGPTVDTQQVFVKMSYGLWR